MGRPKAWLDFAGQPLLSHLVRRMAKDFPEVLVVAAPGQALPETGARRLDDDRPGEGPLAGLEVGLRNVSQPRAFVAACDAPFLCPAVAARLVELCEGYNAVVPRWRGRLQPLHAVYDASIQPVISQQLAQGNRRALDLLQVLRTRIVEEDEIRATDPLGQTFLNLNAPEDYEAAVQLWVATSGATTASHS